MNVAATTTVLTKQQKPATIRDTAERRRTIRTAFTFLAPSLIGVILFLLIPIVMVIGLSLVQWNMLTPMKWVGLSNFVNIFEFDGFGHSLVVTAYYVILNIPIQTVFALGMAMLLLRKHAGQRPDPRHRRPAVPVHPGRDGRDLELDLQPVRSRQPVPRPPGHHRARLVVQRRHRDAGDRVRQHLAVRRLQHAVLPGRPGRDPADAV